MNTSYFTAIYPSVLYVLALNKHHNNASYIYELQVQVFSLKQCCRSVVDYTWTFCSQSHLVQRMVCYQCGRFLCYSPLIIALFCFISDELSLSHFIAIVSLFYCNITREHKVILKEKRP